MDDKSFILFYAWQSDTPQKEGRNFIEKAANKALKKGILDKAPRLDKDTKDIPGTPDIANTILEKIRTSSAFLADLTFVGKDTEDCKFLPNPNVLLELGFAIAYLGWERIICVMNTYYGKPEDLPFDLRHRRWPLRYDLPPGAENTGAKEQLTKELTNAINGIVKLAPRTSFTEVDSRLRALETLVSSMNEILVQIPDMRSSIDKIQYRFIQEEEETNSPENRAKNTLSTLISRVQKQNFEGIQYRQGMLGLVILPYNPLDQELPLYDKEHHIRSMLQPLYCSGWDHQRRGNRFITFSKRGEEVDAVSEITDEGIILAVGHEIISVNRQYLTNIRIPEDVHIIPSVAFEKNIIESIHNYLKLLLDFDVEGPWVITMSFFNLQTSMLYVNPYLSFDGKLFIGDDITPPSIVVPDSIDINDPQSIAQAIKPIFDFIWREHNFPRSLNYDTGGNWVGM